MESTHSKDVIFNMDSLREFIKLIKRQGFENVDFYAVSELLQPPGELVTIVTDNGQEDLNLPYWQQLLNNSERISAENNLKNIFHDIITENGKSSIAFTINTEVELFTPFRKKELLMKSADDNRYYGRGIYQYDTTETNEIKYFKKIESITDLPVADEQYIVQQKYDDSIQQYYEENPTNTQDIKVWLKNYKNNQGTTNNKPNYENYNKLKQCTFSIDFSVPTDDFKKDYPINIYVQEQIDNLLKWIQNDTELSININGCNYYKLSKKEKIYNNLKEAANNVYQDFEDTLYAFIPQSILDQMFIVLNAYKEFNNQVTIYSTPYLKAKQINTSLIGNELYDINKPEWWNYIYTKYNNNYYITAANDSKIYYTEFNEVELKNNPGKIVIVRKNRPWNNEFWYNKYEQNISDENNSKWDMNIKTGRHLYVQAGSLLKFNPGQSTENKDEIDDYWTDTTPGTFSIDENDGQKSHIITIRGFDQNGNFNNKNPIVGYISEENIPNNTDENGAYKIGSNDYNLTPEQLSKLKQLPEEPYTIPVYLNNNNGSITSHEGNFDIVNTNIINAEQGNFDSITVGSGNGIEFGQDLIITSDSEAYRRTTILNSKSVEELINENILQQISYTQDFIVDQQNSIHAAGNFIGPGAANIEYIYTDNTPSYNPHGSLPDYNNYNTVTGFTVTNVYDIGDKILPNEQITISSVAITYDSYGLNAFVATGQEKIMNRDNLSTINSLGAGSFHVTMQEIRETSFITNAENYYILKNEKYIQCKNNTIYTDTVFYYINMQDDNDPAQGLGYEDAMVIGSIATYGGISARKTIKGFKIYAAIFNDYAECRKTIDLEPGKVVIDNDDGSLNCANTRLLPGAQVISDTYGNLIGEMPGVQTPIAVSGRVLVYPYQDRNNYHAGMAVCSAPNGTVDIMTREEIKEYPDCIIGIVSEIPDYEKWGSDQVEVNGRIWIKVK